MIPLAHPRGPPYNAYDIVGCDTRHVTDTRFAGFVRHTFIHLYPRLVYQWSYFLKPCSKFARYHLEWWWYQYSDCIQSTNIPSNHSERKFCKKILQPHQHCFHRRGYYLSFQLHLSLNSILSKNSNL